MGYFRGALAAKSKFNRQVVWSWLLMEQKLVKYVWNKAKFMLINSEVKQKTDEYRTKRNTIAKLDWWKNRIIVKWSRNTFINVSYLDQNYFNRKGKSIKSVGKTIYWLSWGALAVKSKFNRQIVWSWLLTNKN
mgnify:CR=1 FL=1